MATHTGDTTISSQTLDRARVGDDAAWNRILQVYRPRVTRQILRSGVRGLDVNELTMNVFSTAFIKLSLFSRSKTGQHLGCWLGTLTFHIIIDRWRRLKKDQEILALAASKSLNSPVSGRGINHQIRQAAFAAALTELAEEYEQADKAVQWKCFWMHCIDGRTSGEVAKTFDVKLTYVTTTASRVKKRVVELARIKYRSNCEEPSSGDPC